MYGITVKATHNYLKTTFSHSNISKHLCSQIFLLRNSRNFNNMHGSFTQSLFYAHHNKLIKVVGVHKNQR